MIAGLIAFGLAACGSDSNEEGLLSSADADQLLAALDTIGGQADAGNCLSAANGAQDLATQIETQLDNLDPDLQGILIEGTERLAFLARDPETCQGANTETDTTQTTEAPTQTTPPETQTQIQTQTQTQTQTTPPDQGGDQGDQGGGGQDGGGGGNNGSGGASPGGSGQ